jgi:hypothetical protein
VRDVVFARYVIGAYLQSEIGQGHRVLRNNNQPGLLNIYHWSVASTSPLTKNASTEIVSSHHLSWEIFRVGPLSQHRSRRVYTCLSESSLSSLAHENSAHTLEPSLSAMTQIPVVGTRTAQTQEGTYTREGGWMGEKGGR